MIWFFFRVLFSCRFLFHIFIIIIIVSLAIVFAMRARYGFNSNWTRQNSARTAWLAVLCSTHGLSSIKSTKYRKRSYKKTVFIIERIIEMLFIINETIFNSNFGNFFFLLLSISVELSACCVYFIFFLEIVCRVYSFFFWSFLSFLDWNVYNWSCGTCLYLPHCNCRNWDMFRKIQPTNTFSKLNRIPSLLTKKKYY